MFDPMRLLAELPPAEPDAARAEQIRMSCRARLARQTTRSVGSGSPRPPSGIGPLWQALIAILGVAYLTEVIIQAVRVYQLF